MGCIRFLSVVCVSGVLVACGGGGGGSDGTTTTGGETPPQVLALTGSVDGQPNAALSIKAGQSATIDLASGQELSIDSSEGVSWSAALDGVSTQVKVIDPLHWRAALSSDTDKTLTLSAQLGSEQATLTIKLAAQRYTAGLPALGDQFVLASIGTQVDGAVYPEQQINYRVTQVTPADPASKPAGSFVMNEGQPGNVYETELLPGAMSVLFWKSWSGKTCTFTRSPLPVGPLYVGASMSGTTTERCGVNSFTRTDYNWSVSVVGSETTTVRAGVFKTLKLQLVETITATDFGAERVGNVTTRTVWWSPKLSFPVKSASHTAYAQATSGSNIADTTDELVGYTPAN